MDIIEKFGAKVKKLRVEAELSQESLASKANVHRTYMGMIERGEKNVTLKNINKIAKALGITISDLFKGV
jgi:transcriptional regulator with XRE-family HTH domain